MANYQFLINYVHTCNILRTSTSAPADPWYEPRPDPHLLSNFTPAPDQRIWALFASLIMSSEKNIPIYSSPEKSGKFLRLVLEFPDFVGGNVGRDLLGDIRDTRKEVRHTWKWKSRRGPCKIRYQIITICKIH